MPNTPPFRIRGLGEIAIRCADLAAMTAFYRDILGLEVLPGNAAPHIVFFRIAAGFGGHTQVLALFDEGDPGQAGPRSALHHIALSLPYADQDAAMAWYTAHGLSYRVEYFDWIGWRGVFTTDPEGNTVELVAQDPNWHPPQP